MFIVNNIKIECENQNDSQRGLNKIGKKVECENQTKQARKYRIVINNEGNNIQFEEGAAGHVNSKCDDEQIEI